MLTSLQIVEVGAKGQIRLVVHEAKENAELRESFNRFRRVGVDSLAVEVENLFARLDVLVQWPNHLLGHLYVPNECALRGNRLLRFHKEVHGPGRIRSRDEGLAKYEFATIVDSKRRSTATVNEAYVNSEAFVLSELSNSKHVNSNPSALFVPKSFLRAPQSVHSRLRRPFAGSGLDDGLISYHFGLVRLVFHPVHEILRSVCLFASGNSEIVGIGTAGFHFVELPLHNRLLTDHGPPLKNADIHFSAPRI
jgi:hypothetical protein